MGMMMSRRRRGSKAQQLSKLARAERLLAIQKGKVDEKKAQAPEVKKEALPKGQVLIEEMSEEELELQAEPEQKPNVARRGRPPKVGR